jgi:hypothetical protein
MLPVRVRRVLLAQHRVDFRKGMDGLLGEAYRIGAQPYEGDCVVYVKKDRTQIRALVGDGLGLYLVSRRFEGGRLRLLLRFADVPSTKTVTTVLALAHSVVVRPRCVSGYGAVESSASLSA